MGFYPKEIYIFKRNSRSARGSSNPKEGTSAWAVRGHCGASTEETSGDLGPRQAVCISGATAGQDPDPTGGQVTPLRVPCKCLVSALTCIVPSSGSCCHLQCTLAAVVVAAVRDKEGQGGTPLPCTGASHV